MTRKQLTRLVCLFVFVLSGSILVAQQNATTAAKAGKSGTSITGCVQKGTEPNGYVLKDDSGKTWELTDSAAKVADHVGHKVTITGSSVHESKAEEKKMANTEKAEADGKPYADFKVSSVKMISESCQ